MKKSSKNNDINKKSSKNIVISYQVTTFGNVF